MKVLLLCLIIFSLSSKADEVKKYLRLHSKFRKEVCSRGTTRKYFDLLSLTRKTGNYVPINEGKLNTFVVQKNLILLRQKRKWIKSLENELSIKQISRLKRDALKLGNELETIVELKQNHWKEKNRKNRITLAKKSKEKVSNFKTGLALFLDKLSPLHTFGYPVNHLEMRGKYDSLKIRKDPLGINLAQDLFFKRKIYEDGAPHPRWRGTDKSIRTLINTIRLMVDENNGEGHFISETLRYDLAWLLPRVEKYLSYDLSLIKRELFRWGKKVSDQIEFYNQLLSGKISLKGKSISVKDFIEDNLGAKSRLEDYIYEKQADTYEFWSKQDEEQRRLFVSETIILNEVGGTPDPGDIEKQEVLKVVHKRSRLKFYSSLGGTKELVEKLNERGIKTSGMKWLNTLFKKGEFSFTYYFIPGVRHIFCPDMSPKANGIRETALSIALKLRGKNFNTPNVPVRYFSRQSMLGRIDMSKLWANFHALPEEPGPKLDNEFFEENADDPIRYTYSFMSSSKSLYNVFVKGNKYFIKSDRSGELFHYRNPNFFKYFIEK